ncbi:metabotropic glutamate receptor [Holotrichia oblita]|uniref:Metabotropic glutamate receptor n=1 Tax=Holotrichia oblita TaxID=644536 RepID=A0ACB9TT18_HOLOL|nr:metabotropic glutamate receptor [Holotrichia oblita]
MEFGDLVESIAFNNKKTDLNARISNYFNRTVPHDHKTNLNTSHQYNESYALERRLELSTEFFLVPKRPTAAITTTTSTPRSVITKTVCTGCLPEDKIDLGLFRNEVWVVPLLTLASILIAIIVCFEIYVLLKATKTTPSRRHLFLGQMLLLGLFACASLAVILAASPTPFTCGAIRFGTGTAYAIIFASLLVKCVFLISLNNGVYLPATYQSLLLLFAILIQVAIGIQWLITNPPDIHQVTFDMSPVPPKHQILVTADDVTKSMVLSLCHTSYTDMLLSLIYVVFLILFVSVLAMRSRSIRSNYRESTYIGMSVLCCIPSWLVWSLSGFMVNERHKDACLGFGLIVTAGVIFLVMFMPKGRQLAAIGKDGLYMEDREESFSSMSRTGSGYSPSFFHFKPPKYAFESTEKCNNMATLQGNFFLLFKRSQLIMD